MRFVLIDRSAPFDYGLRPSAHAKRAPLGWLTDFEYTRFNLWTNFVMMRYALPDVFVLMIVGTIPDYVQGSIKLGWTLRGKPATA